MTSFVDGATIGRATGAGIRVAIIDSGVETSHPALAGAAIDCRTITTLPGRRTSIVADTMGDLSGHGTAVAAVIREFAPAAAITSVRVLSADLRGTSERILGALNWAIDEQFDVVNCSFGTGDIAFLEGYKRVVDRAFCANVMIVSACNNFDSRRIELPGWFPTVIAADHGAFEGLSFERRPGDMVEFAARGRDVRLPWRRGTYQVVTGSSFAAPHVAALVARIREIHPQWNACEVKTALYALARGAAAASA